MMRRITKIAIAIGFLFTLNSCEKEEDVVPETPIVTSLADTTVNGGSGGGSANVVVANVNGLKQNFIEAGSLGEDRLSDTWIDGYNSGGDEYYKIYMLGSDYNFTMFIKGNKLREGNFSLKKFRLGSNPSASEVVVYSGIDGNLLDFESTDNNAVSIQKDGSGFFIIKMAPIVGINRNSWDDVITEPISIHAVTNHAKLSTSNTTGDVFANDKYSFRTRYNTRSNQPITEVYNLPIEIDFRDYDFSSITSLPKTKYTLNKTQASVSQIFNGTAHKALNMTYVVSGQGWKQNFNLNQDIEAEITPSRIIVEFNNIEFVNPNDASETKTISGKWEMAR